MSEKEHQPIRPGSERSEISVKPETPQEPQRETRELLEKPPTGESEESRQARTAEIKGTLRKLPTEGGIVPQPLETEPAKPATKMEYLKAIAYEKLIDPILEKVRGLISDFIPQNTTVIDIGCGTGALAFRLAKDKDCTVYGVDLAPGKIERANNRKTNANFPKVQFSEADATSLAGISDQQFDYATMSLFLHSLPEDVRRKVLQEAMRIAKRIIIADYVTEQPKSFSGIAVRGIERIAGGEHFQNFNQFRASEGLETLLKDAELVIVEEQLNPSKTVRVIVAERQKVE